jgi:hypothetical protein
MTMLQQMEAEICFIDQNEMNAAIPALIENDFDVEVLDWIDDYGSCAWVLALAKTELDESSFLDFVGTIIDPFGMIVEAGLSSKRRTAEPPAFEYVN